MIEGVQGTQTLVVRITVGLANGQCIDVLNLLLRRRHTSLVHEYDYTRTLLERQDSFGYSIQDYLLLYFLLSVLSVLVWCAATKEVFKRVTDCTVQYGAVMVSPAWRAHPACPGTPRQALGMPPALHLFDPPLTPTPLAGTLAQYVRLSGL